MLKALYDRVKRISFKKNQGYSGTIKMTMHKCTQRATKALFAYRNNSISYITPPYLKWAYFSMDFVFFVSLS